MFAAEKQQRNVSKLIRCFENAIGSSSSGISSKTNPPVSRLRLGGLVILPYKPQMDEKSRGTEIEYSGICVRRIRELCRQRGIAINCLAAMRDVKHSTLDNIVRGLPKNPERKPCIRSRRLLI